MKNPPSFLLTFMVFSRSALLAFVCVFFVCAFTFFFLMELDLAYCGIIQSQADPSSIHASVYLYYRGLKETYLFLGEFV